MSAAPGWYRALLHLYPSGFRAEYGDELCRAFAARRRAATNPFGIAGLGLGALVDVARNAALVHADVLRQDLRFAARSMGRAPGFTATAILVTALGIGANTAVFSVADRALTSPLPYPGADRLVRLWENADGYAHTEVSPPNYQDWRNRATSFESIAAFHGTAVNMGGASEPARLEGAAVDGDLLPLLGVAPLLGRPFSADDGLEGAPGTLLLSYGTWQGLFGGRSSVLGSTVRLDDQVATVIGVMPPQFSFPSREVQIWTPMRMTKEDREDRDNHYLNVIARLRPGVSVEQARAEMDEVTRQLATEYPEANRNAGATVDARREQVGAQTRLLLIALVGAALCVLLIACANLAGLLLARALGRGKELTVRSALGAGRDRLARQLLTEALVLAAAGGLLGVLVAMAAVPMLAALVPSGLPVASPTALDARVLVFAGALTALTGLAFGVAPAMRIGGADNLGSLRSQTSAAAGAGANRLRSALVAGEMAACLVLLVASGLLLRALGRIQSTDPGFRAEGVVAVETPLTGKKYETTARRVAVYSRILAEVRALPDVERAAYITGLPMVRTGGIWGVTVAGAAPENPDEPRKASLRFVSPGFFDTLGIPLRQGRDVAEGDTAGQPFVAVVSESFVRQYLPGREPLGQRFEFGLAERTLVGVVADIRVRGLERESEPQVYLPYGQVDDGGLMGYLPKELVIRTGSDQRPTTGLVGAVREIVRRADPELPLANVRPLEDDLFGSTAPRRTQIAVLAAFTALSLLLAGIGMYGLLALAVSQRLPELSVRMAMGARGADILKIVLRQGLTLVALGGFGGLVLAYAAGRGLEALLAGIRPSDAPSFLAAIALALLAGLAGSLPPALRAVRANPAQVLRGT